MEYKNIINIKKDNMKRMQKIGRKLAYIEKKSIKRINLWIKDIVKDKINENKRKREIEKC